MPTYEYACKTCGNRFEAWQKMTDEPLTECPKCHSEIHRVLFPAGVVFKGSGFYSTDSRGHKSGGETAATGKSETSGESKTEAKTETKTEAVPAAKSESSTAQSSTDSAKAG
jgi:putative FmdB family regulatory protein